MSADNNIIDYDVDIALDNSDNDNEQDLERKRTKTSKWILGKKPVNFKKKISFFSDNQKDCFKDESITNGYEGNSKHYNPKEIDIEQGLAFLIIYHKFYN